MVTLASKPARPKAGGDVAPGEGALALCCLSEVEAMSVTSSSGTRLPGSAGALKASSPRLLLHWQPPTLLSPACLSKAAHR